MSFEEEYVNILDGCLDRPSLTVSNNTHSNPLNSVIQSLTGINWFNLYQLGSNKKESFQVKFHKIFDAVFYKDPLVIKQIEQIISLELKSGLLDSRYANDRRIQVTKWLRDYYYNKSFDACNISTTTRNDHQLVLKLAYVTMSFILPQIFKDGIWISKKSFSSFQVKLTGLKNSSLLLLPNHKSHIDYIIIHFLYVRFNLETPMVIAGENLDVPIFGPILKKLGAVYIKRKFNTHEDFYYKQNIQNVLNFKINHDILNKSSGIELFIEGTRSRNGKLMHPKTGFLGILKDSVEELDIMIQPISLTYEKPYEFQEYLIELNGLDKRQETFGDILKVGVKLLLGKSPNFGKLIINIDDDMIQMDKGSDIQKIAEEVLVKIEKIGYITEISVLCLSLIINFYMLNKNQIEKVDVIPVYRELVRLIRSKTSEANYNKILVDSLDYSTPQLIQFFDSLFIKFLPDDIVIKVSSYVIKEEISLVYYKNSLLNLFINEIFQLKINHSLQNLTILSKVFQFEFLTSLIDLSSTSVVDVTPGSNIFQNLLDPFLESYELVLDNLTGVITINLKDWLHLFYISTNITAKYRESLNKSNVLNAIYSFQSLNLLKVNKQNDIIVLDEPGIIQFKQFLNSIRNNQSFNSNELLIYTNYFTESTKL